LSEPELSAARELEQRLEEQARLLAHLQRLKNDMEQYIYAQKDQLRQLPDNVVSASESDALLALLGQKEEWLLYSEEAEGISHDELNSMFQQLQADVAACAPAFAQHTKDREAEKAAAALAAAEAEKARQDTHRDKLTRPITTKEKLEAAQKRKEQGSKCFKYVSRQVVIVYE
jgi:arsenate reductase-like glutaredoxin family protein